MLYFYWPLWVEFSIGKRYLFSEIPATFCTQEGEVWCCWQLSRYLFAQLLSSWSKGSKLLMQKEGVEKVKAYRHSLQDWMNRHTVLVHNGQYKKIMTEFTSRQRTLEDCLDTLTCLLPMYEQYENLKWNNISGYIGF